MTVILALAISLLAQSAPPPPVAPTTGMMARFQQVDSKLYRGAQPDADGFRQLRNLGVRTIVNLRSEEDAVQHDEQRIVESLGMRYVSVPIKDGNFFTRSRIVPADAVQRFFAVVDAATEPVFVHCRRGADRTGALVALYRIARNGWENERAYAEARALGMRSWYSGLKQQILAFRPDLEAAR